jgi:formylglycine-generating enzyme required for sulfatase activity
MKRGLCGVVGLILLLAGRASAGGAAYLVIDLSPGPEAERYAVQHLAGPPPGGWTDEHKTTRLVLRRIPAGAFTMGSPTHERGRSAHEDQRKVTLTRDFYIGVFEVTQRQWERVMGDWPSYFSHPDLRDMRPVEQVISEDIRGIWSPVASQFWVGPRTFLHRLRARTGLDHLDLPTEAQWEYACRAGTTTALNTVQDLTSTDGVCLHMNKAGRYWENARMERHRMAEASTGTAVVGSYAPNAWGLHDMHGNVWELCLDSGHSDGAMRVGLQTDPVSMRSGPSKVVRGGSWRHSARFARSAHRGVQLNHLHRSFAVGFRLALHAP